MPDTLPHYLDVDGQPVFAVLHRPSPAWRSTAVLIIPPFGWEESSSYRSRRSWAAALAADGFPALRLDLPGTGNSAGSPTDAGLVESWLRTIARAAVELRSSTGCEKVAVIGLGLGGLLACAASAAGAELDELVLWAVPSLGVSVTRELKAFARLEASYCRAPSVRGADPIINGFVMSTATTHALDDVDLTVSPPVGVSRALLLDRDGIPIDPALHEALAKSGAAVALLPGNGYGQLMAEPQLSAPPRDVIAQVSQWLRVGTAKSVPEPSAQALRTAAVIAADGMELSERPLALDLPTGRAFGVLSEPCGEARSVCVVLLNAGGVRHIGPNRMWVEASRRWAARGVSTFRVDLPGIGEAGGSDSAGIPDSDLYAADGTETIRAVLDALDQIQVPQRFMVAGLCSGAYWSFQVAQADERVASIVMLNPMALVYDPFQWTVRRSRFVGRIARWRTHRRILHGDVPLADFFLVARAVFRLWITAPTRVRARVLARRAARRAGGDELDLQLDRVCHMGTAAHLAFSDDEPLYDELARDGRFKRLGRWPNLSLHLLEGPSSAHMLQPSTLQVQAHALMDAALDALLESSTVASLVQPPQGQSGHQGKRTQDQQQH